MNDLDVTALLRECLIVILKLGGPPLIIGLVIGLLISFIQAVTQINEATLAFLPKIAAIAVSMLLLAPYMAATLGAFTRLIFDRIVDVGGS